MVKRPFHPRHRPSVRRSNHPALTASPICLGTLLAPADGRREFAVVVLRERRERICERGEGIKETRTAESDGQSFRALYGAYTAARWKREPEPTANMPRERLIAAIKSKKEKTEIEIRSESGTGLKRDASRRIDDDATSRIDDRPSGCSSSSCFAARQRPIHLANSERAIGQSAGEVYTLLANR